MSRLAEMPRVPDFGVSVNQHPLAIHLSEDGPGLLQAELVRSSAEHGPPIMAFVSPAFRWPTTRSAVDSPEKVVALFEDWLHVISRRANSQQIDNLEIPRSHLLGCSMAEFLLDSWFTLYHGVEPSRLTVIPFGVGAGKYYRSFADRLWGWLPQTKGSCFPRKILPFRSRPCLPSTFSDFLGRHPEITPHMSFFQRGLAISRGHRPFWPSLFLGFSDSHVLVISDQYYDYPSAQGLEATFFSLDAVSRLTWTDRSLLRRACIAVELEQKGRTLELSWPACPDLKHRAADWIERANSSLGDCHRKATPFEPDAKGTTCPGPSSRNPTRPHSVSSCSSES